MFEQAFCRGDGRRMFAKHLIVGLGMLAWISGKALVSKKAALQYSPNPEQLKLNLQGIYLGDDHKILG